MERTQGCDCKAMHPETVEAVRQQMTEDSVILSAVEFYKILGDATRMRLLCALVEQELCVGDLCTLLDMTKSAVSHQLSKLKEIGQVKIRREGKQVYYSLANEQAKEILEQTFKYLGYRQNMNQTEKPEQNLPSWLL